MAKTEAFICDDCREIIFHRGYVVQGQVHAVHEGKVSKALIESPGGDPPGPDRHFCVECFTTRISWAPGPEGQARGPLVGRDPRGRFTRIEKVKPEEQGTDPTE